MSTVLWHSLSNKPSSALSNKSENRSPVNNCVQRILNVVTPPLLG